MRIVGCRNVVCVTVAVMLACGPAGAAVAEAPVQPVPPAVEEPAVADAGPQDGLTEGGRAINDPRVEAKPVDVVEIVTAHPTLFSDSVAPSVVPSGKVTPRASNDPRASSAPAPAAEAAG